MASFQRTLNLDSLTLTSLYVRGYNNSNIPAFRVLTTDGLGGTMWITISSMSAGAGFNSIVTTTGTYTANTSGASFSLLDGPNAGIISDPTASNTAYLYAKAFGQIDISGGNSVSAFNSLTNRVTSNLTFNGTGGIEISADPQKNIITFDGRQLPFISTVPYSFSQFNVYSNVPTDTVQASTFSSILIQANGPSSVISFVGLDPVTLYTDYQTNQIKISVSGLTTKNVSTLFGQQAFLISTSVTNIILSTFSTSYGANTSFGTVQDMVSSVSTGIYRSINSFSTSVGNTTSLYRGLSTVWNASQRNAFLLGLSTSKIVLSTNASVQGDITNIYNLIQTDYNVLKGSTLETPYLWASTLVQPIGSNLNPIVTPSPAIQAVGLTYYPTYPSYYNIFNDTQSVGSPSGTSIYTTNIITDNANAISTVSTSSGLIFSSNYALSGTFTFYPQDDTRPISVTYSGALYMNIANKSYGQPIPQYPKLNDFATSTINDTLIGFTPITVNFTYLKANPTDSISFSNMYDVLTDTVSYRVAPLYAAYGYNTSDAPLYTTTRSGTFPIGFSTLGGPIGPYVHGLSTYVLVASTIYTAGCNTIFPITTSGGFTSFSFYEGTTARTAQGYSQNLSNSIVANITSTFSASNAFGYTFKDNIPSTPYTFQLVYGLQNPNEKLTISSLLYSEKAYDRAYAVYFSSMLYGSTVSSYNGNFVNLNVSTLTVDSINVSSIFLSTTLYTQNVSSYTGAFNNLYASSLQVNSLIYSTIYSIFPSTYTISSLLVSSINNGVLLGGSGNTTSTTSSLVTYLNELASTMNYNMSSFSPSGSGGSANTTSTVSSFVTYINQLASTMNYNMSSFSPVGGGGSANTTSTVSSFVTYINQLASTMNYNMSSFSASGSGGSANTTSTTSTLVTYLNELASTMNYNMSSFSASGSGGSANTTSTVSSFVTYINQLASSISFNMSSFSTTNSSQEFRTSTIYTSSITTAGLRQPFIQYGTVTTSGGTGTVTIPIPYKDASYIIQLTPAQALTYSGTVTATVLNAASFTIGGTAGPSSVPNGSYFWTTFGDLF